MGYIPEDVIAQVLDRSDIVEIIGLYIPLKQAGRNFKAISPFTQEKTPSFFVSPEKQIFHCFSSGKGGNVISFVMMQERMTFPEAVRFLAQKAGITVPETAGQEEKPEVKKLRDTLLRINQLAVDFFHQELLTSRDQAAERARAYLKERGVTLDMVKMFSIGYAPDTWDKLLLHLRGQGIADHDAYKAGLINPRRDKTGFYDRFRNRVMFPVFDYRGQPVAFGGRALAQDEMAKYINSPETPLYVKGRHLYGFQLSKEAVAREDGVIIVEGYLDFIMPYQAGITHCVASLGTALTPQQIRLLRRYTRNVFMLYDTDEAGQEAMLRSIDLLIEEDMNTYVVQLDGNHDPDSFIRAHDAESLRQRVKEAQTAFDFKFNMFVRKHDPTSVEGRAQICDAMLSMINRYSNEVVKAEYIKKLSRELGISEHAVQAQAKQAQYGSRSSAQTPEQAKKDPLLEIKRTAEWELVVLLMNHGDLIPQAKEVLDVDDVDHSEVKDVLKVLYEHWDHDQVIHPKRVMSQCSESIQSLLTETVVESKTHDEHSERVLQACLKRIKEKCRKQKRQHLLQQIRQAERLGNHHEVEELQKAFKKLVVR